MGWGDVPAWVALVVAGGAAWIAYLARKDSKESARASVRSADAAESSLALQREDAEVRRDSARPRVELTLEYDGGHAWLLTNVGDAQAEDVTVDTTGLEGVLSDAPSGVQLIPNASHKLYISPTFDTADPTHLLVTWAGQETPVALPIRRP